MNKRQLRKIVKQRGDKWWILVEEDEHGATYALIPPGKWNTRKIINEFHRQKKTEHGYLYQIWI